ncbi:MAG: hypothetical protein JWO06_92, partial [Bacteroidota bacterium]|nr:hypothetical protein [Bacteroidota bacterium]
ENNNAKRDWAFEYYRNLPEETLNKLVGA